MSRELRRSHYYQHNLVKLIKGGSEYFALLEQLIDNAQNTIHLQTYIFSEDETGLRIADALIASARRGVHVYLLIDAYASQGLSSHFLERLISEGVNLRMFNPILKSRHFYFGRRLHHKVFVSDGQEALVGGINVSNRYNDFAGVPAWMDWALYIHGDAVEGLTTVCEWRMRSGRGRRKFRDMPPGRPAYPLYHQVRLRIRINDWVRGQMEITNSYLNMFNWAHRQIHIMCSYFLPGTEIRRALRKAARRGVRIKVIVASVSDVALSKYAERFLYTWMFRNNIEVYEYQPSILHSKLSVCDSQLVTVGSYNINNISAYASIELNVEVNDADFARRTEERLEEIIMDQCMRITETEYIHRFNLLTRLAQRMAYQLFRVLFFAFTFYFRPLRPE